LSLNKIIERKHKNKIDELRKLEITVSVWTYKCVNDIVFF
jgi:hypothetical protein